MVRQRLGTSTRVLACLSVMLVVFRASSAPVHDIVEPRLLASPAEVQAQGTGESYMALPSYSKLVDKLKEDFAHTVASTSNLFTNFSCATCRYAVKLLRDMFDLRMSFDAIADAVGEVCYLAKVQDETVCKGVAQTFKDEVLTVFSMVALSPEEVCAGYLDQCGSEYDPFNQSWNITVPGNKPAYKPLPTPLVGSPVTRILQLTDLHYDPEYTEGLSNQCNEPLCCRPPNAKGSGSTAAGRWGDYHNCDVPERTVLNLFQHLNKTHDQFDMVYWTGDVTPHNIWNQTRTGTLSQMSYFYSLFEKYLPGKPVFFTFGNHDTVPVNSYPQPFIKGNQSNEWIANPTIKSWSRWLSRYPDWTTTQETIKKGGYYNVKVMDGLRIIGLQTTYCEKQNFWMLVNATDPAGQLQWLANQLQAAEKAGDKVHILGHHPPGMDSLPNYGINYKRIINRFESTIVGQFYGHTHTDFFKIFTTDDDDHRPTNVLYISPGVTSYPGLNFGYRIYTVDGNYSNSTHQVLDHETYIFDIEKANNLSKDATPEWEFEYSAKKFYNMTSLSPEGHFDLWKRLKEGNNKDELLQLFSKHYYKGRQKKSLSYRFVICNIVKNTLHDSPLCPPKESDENSQNLVQQSYYPRHAL